MNVLSMFNGMSGLKLAADKIGLDIDNLYISEIDKFANKVTMHHFPESIQLGDVNDVYKWKLPQLDLITAGSPCQGFSFAGKQLNFEDDRSKLFFKFIEALQKFKPKYFLLENVMMKQEYQDIITSYLGVEPIKINSSLFSAQNRIRLYWTNIPVDSDIKDKGILLKDIVETNEEVVGAAMRGRYTSNGKTQQFIEARKDGKANALTTATKNSLCIQVGETQEIKGFDIIKRVYSQEGKCPTLTTMSGGHREPKIAIDDVIWRKLTPLECERLQNVPDNFTAMVSNSQRYKMLGNGWTIDVIAHILNGILTEEKQNSTLDI